jgi:hypothetical protein
MAANRSTLRRVVMRDIDPPAPGSASKATRKTIPTTRWRDARRGAAVLAIIVAILTLGQVNSAIAASAATAAPGTASEMAIAGVFSAHGYVVGLLVVLLGGLALNLTPA